MLHYVPRSEEIRFCGPTALAAVSNLKPKEIHEYLASFIPLKTGQIVEGMRATELEHALDIMGYKHKRIEFRQGGKNESYWERVKAYNAYGHIPRPRYRSKFLSLARFMVEHGAKGTWIINVTGHFMAVCNGLICDTFQRMPHILNRIDRPKRNVIMAWQIENP